MIFTPLFQQQTITIFLGTNPAQVAWRSITKDILKSIAKDIQSLSSQSECAFNDIHCFSIHLCHLKHAYLSVEDTKWLIRLVVCWISGQQICIQALVVPLCFLIWSNKQLHHFANTEVNHCFSKQKLVYFCQCTEKWSEIKLLTYFVSSAAQR